MQAIDKALKDLASQESPNYSTTARKHSIYRTTLLRRYRCLARSRAINIVNIKSLLTPQQEKELVNYINKLLVFRLPPVILIIWNFAFNIPKKMPGKNQPTYFISKYSLKLDFNFLKGFNLS